MFKTLLSDIQCHLGLRRERDHALERRLQAGGGNR